MRIHMTNSPTTVSAKIWLAVQAKSGRLNRHTSCTDGERCQGSSQDFLIRQVPTLFLNITASLCHRIAWNEMLFKLYTWFPYRRCSLVFWRHNSNGWRRWNRGSRLQFRGDIPYAMHACMVPVQLLSNLLFDSDTVCILLPIRRSKMLLHLSLKLMGRSALKILLP